MKTSSNIMNICEFLLCLIFPNRCCFCSRLTDVNEYICEECQKSFPFIKGEICYNCGADKSRCKCKNSGGHFYEKLIAPLYYEDSVKTCIHNFKFRDEKYNYKCLAELMVNKINEHYNDIHFDYIAYIPMRRKNQRKRGYNQSRLLAKFISEETNIPLADKMLIKIYETKNQHDCNKIERSGNLFGVFDVNTDYDVNGKNILLVDDVATTGTTLCECGKMLYLSGAENVYCAVAAIRCNKKKEEQDDRF